MEQFSFEVFVIGTGTAAYHIVSTLAGSGYSVGVVDMREYGGTCALRGCQAKKFFVTHAEIRALVRSLRGKGFGSTESLHSSWKQILDFKNSFTDYVPKSTENSFVEAGATLFHGHARFLDSRTVEVGDARITSKYFVIATGSRPASLNIKGQEYAIDSEAFLSMESEPSSCVFIGGGYIAYEFAYLLSSFDVNVSILQRSKRMLRQFDEEMVGHLVEHGRELGLQQHVMSVPTSIEQRGKHYVLNFDSGIERKSASITADRIVNASGRVANTDDLGLEHIGIPVSQSGIEVDPYLRCIADAGVHNTVFAIGDVVASSPQLAPVADVQGSYIASLLERLLATAYRKPESLLGDEIKPLVYPIIPSVVFTHPQLAMVGLTEQKARERYGNEVTIRSGSTASWPSSKRVGETHGWYKMLYYHDELVGAHLFRHEAGESINVCALAIGQNITRTQLKSAIWAYPTMGSDIKYML